MPHPDAASQTAGVFIVPPKGAKVGLCHCDAVSVLQGADVCEVTSTAGQPTTVAAKATAAAATADSCLIRVSFEKAFANSGLVATTTVNVVFMQTLVLRPQNYDFTSAQGTLGEVADDPPAYTALQPIACSLSDYEQVAFRRSANCFTDAVLC